LGGEKGSGKHSIAPLFWQSTDSGDYFEQLVVVMHLSMCCPTTPLRLKWGFDTKKNLPHYGAFDKFLKVFLASSPHIAPGVYVGI